MGEFWTFMGPAVLAAVFMSPIHALFGLHIVRRGLIFIDLAVAQVAAFGMSLAIGQGYEAQSPTAYWYSVGFALAGALLISVTRFRLGRVPHEAIIGVVYVLATAASIIVLEFSPSGHGLEELKNMLAGNILFVTSDQLRSTAWSYGIILAILLVLWRSISRLTLAGEKEKGARSVLLDFVFYSLLGFVVASSVKIAGVLVVFSWLVMPAVVAFFFVDKLLAAAAVALPVGVIGSILGLLVSYHAPALKLHHVHEAESTIEYAGAAGWPSGPAIVATIGSIIAVAYVARLLIRQRSGGANE